MRHHPYSGPAWLCLLAMVSCNGTQERENQHTDTVVLQRHHQRNNTTPPAALPEQSNVSFTRAPVIPRNEGFMKRQPLLRYTDLQPPAIVKHEIEVLRDTVIQGGQGLALTIPAGAFVHEDGTAPAGKVEFHLQSFCDNLSILKQGLTTTCNGEVIETGGMFYCDASAGGRPLKLRKAISVRLQTTARKEGMQVFYGTPQPDGYINWIPDSTAAVSAENTKPVTGTRKQNLSWWASGPDGYGDKVSGYVWDVTAREKREKFRQLDSGRPGEWTSFIYRDLLKANEQLWQLDYNLTKIQVSMCLRENAYYELAILPAGNRMLDSIISFSIKNYWTTTRFPRSIRQRDQVCYTGTFYLNLAPAGNRYLSELFRRGKDEVVVASGESEVQEVTNYALNITRMGWVNCDRFVNVREKTDVIVMIPPKFKGRVQLVLSDISAFMPGIQHGDRIAFKGVPAGEKIKVVWFDADYNGQLKLATYSGIADGRKIPVSIYRRVTLGQLQTEMASL